MSSGSCVALACVCLGDGSGSHCTFVMAEQQGEEGEGAAVVTVTDRSTNGTYVNGVPVGKFKSRVIKVPPTARWAGLPRVDGCMPACLRHG